MNASTGAALQPATEKTAPDNSEATTQPTMESDLHEAIARRAYELYEERGYEGGHETEDWLLAESEIRGTTE
jgi:hypothetical protein